MADGPCQAPGPGLLWWAGGRARVPAGGSRCRGLTPECSSRHRKVSSATAAQAGRLERTSAAARVQPRRVGLGSSHGVSV